MSGHHYLLGLFPRTLPSCTLYSNEVPSIPFCVCELDFKACKYSFYPAAEDVVLICYLYYSSSIVGRIHITSLHNVHGIEIDSGRCKCPWNLCCEHFKWIKICKWNQPALPRELTEWSRTGYRREKCTTWNFNRNPRVFPCTIYLISSLNASNFVQPYNTK